MIKHQLEVKPNLIAAQLEISESELVKVLPNYSSKMETENPTRFKLMLYNLGMDISQDYERQDAIQHRNRFNEIVVCSRWVGSERVDPQWIESGYASKAAKDKASGCKLLEDSYRARQMTEDVQDKLTERDSRVIREEVEE
jgi:hypothetical protein